MNNKISILYKFREIAADIKLVDSKVMTLLRSPLLSSVTDEVLKSKLNHLRCMWSRLNDLDAHNALFLLKNKNKNKLLCNSEIVVLFAVSCML